MCSETEWKNLLTSIHIQNSNIKIQIERKTDLKDFKEIL